MDLHRANWGVYGVRKLWHAARRAGLQVGRDQVGRLMAIAGITGAVRGRHRTITTRCDRSAPRTRTWSSVVGTPRLGSTTVGCGLLLCVDAGRVRLRGVLVDVFSRRILGWRVSSSKQTALVLDAFRQALHIRHRGQPTWTATGLIHHSDAGSQYVSVAFTAELLEAGIAGSIGTVGDALDNALCESTIGLFKTEAIHAVVARPRRGRMAGRPLGPLVQHHPPTLLDRAPAPH